MNPLLMPINFLFREHRGGLKDSVRTIRYFDNLEQLLIHLENKELYKKGDKFLIDPYIHDLRLLWDTQIILVNRRPVGYIDRAIRVPKEFRK